MGKWQRFERFSFNKIIKNSSKTNLNAYSILSSPFINILLPKKKILTEAVYLY